jgi:glycosyltransferase involved in cell wall biosynthesis
MGKKLSRLGFDIEVFTLRENALNSREELIDGIKVRRIIDAPRYKTSLWGTRNYWDIFRFTLALIKMKKNLGEFDLLIFNKWPILTPMLLPWMLNNKTVIDWCEIRRTKFWRCIYKLMGHKRLLHIGVNEEIGDYLAGELKIPKENIKTVLSGIESKNYKTDSAKQEKRILFFGRLSDHKDPEIVIKSFLAGDLGKKGYELDIAGGGPLLERLKAQYDGSNGIHVLGPVSDEKKIQLLKASTLLVLPSKREGFPRVIAEAAAAGTPTLTTDYPENGSVHVVEKYKVGWVCTPDVMVLAKKIETCGKMGDEWLEKSRACEDAARKYFDWDIVCREFLNFVEA